MKVAKMYHQSNNEEDRRTTVIKTSIATLVFLLLTDIIFVPALIARLKGIRRIFSVMQQLSAIGHVVLLLLPFVIKDSGPDSAQDYINGVYDSKQLYTNGMNLLYRYLHFHQLFEALKNFFNLVFHFASLMQSVDIYIMICRPFDYSDFCKIRNLTKILAAGMSICLLLTT